MWKKKFSSHFLAAWPWGSHLTSPNSVIHLQKDDNDSWGILYERIFQITKGWTHIKNYCNVENTSEFQIEKNIELQDWRVQTNFPCNPMNKWQGQRLWTCGLGGLQSPCPPDSTTVPAKGEAGYWFYLNRFHSIRLCHDKNIFPYSPWIRNEVQQCIKATEARTQAKWIWAYEWGWPHTCNSTTAFWEAKLTGFNIKGKWSH